MASVHPAAQADEIDKLQAERIASRVSPGTRLAGVLTGHSRHTQYTAEKFLALDQFARSTSRWRLARLILGTPLPSLLTLLLPPLLPLRDPLVGPRHDPGFCVHFVLVMGFTVFGAIYQGRSVTGLSSKSYPTWKILLVSMLSSTHLLGVTILIASVWRFPVPFTWAADFLPWVFCLIWSFFLVFRHEILSGELKQPVIAFFPSFVVQISQILLYPAFSAAFSSVNEIQQVLLMLCFPVIKYLMKKAMRMASFALHDFSEEVAVSGVEICAAMYQSQLMQNTTSSVATAVIIGVDVIQGVASVKLFMDKKNEVVARHEIVSSALKILQPPHEETEITKIPTSVITNDPRNAKIIQHALEIVHTAESILLVEYFEVAIPIVNGVFLAVAAQLPSALYNPHLRPFYQQPERLQSAMVSLMVYALLQGLSVVAMNLIMWYRFRISAVAQLAFVLERHQGSLQGKLFSWLAVFFNFTVMHYGTDFTFKFDFSMPTDG